jgi:lysophospholipase L1-like esterase
VAASLIAGLAAGTAATAPSMPSAKKRCHFVVKKVRGKTKRVRVCTKPKPKHTWSYVALGDSLTTGGGQVPSAQTYPSVFAGFVRKDTGRAVTVHNLGQNGATSADLLAALRDPSTGLRSALRKAQIVTVDIGFNDFGGDVIDAYGQRRCGGADNEDCLRAMVTRFTANFGAILDEILAIRSPSTTIIRVLDQYNNLIGNPELVPVVGASFGATVGMKYTVALNVETCLLAQARGIPCGDVYHAFNGPTGLDNLFDKHLLADGDHPNAAGHQLIAGVLRSLGYAPLSA